MLELKNTILTTMKNPLNYINQYPQRTREILGISFEQLGDLINRAETLAK